MTFSMRFLGYPEDSLQILQEGEKLAKDLCDKKSLANFYSRIGIYYSLKGDPRGVEYTEMSFNASQDIQDVELMSLSATSLCFSYLLAGEYQKVTEVARNAINLLDNTQRQAVFFAGAAVNVYSALCGYCGVSFAMLGDFEKGEGLMEKGRRLARKLNHLPTLSIIEYCYGYSLSWKGDGKNSKRYFENCVSYGEEGQIIMILGLALSGLGYGCYLLEDFKAARNYVKRGLKIHLDTGNPFYLSFMYWVLGMIDFQEGDLSNAHTHIKKAIELSQQNNERAIEGGALTWQGRILGKIDSSQIKKAKEFILNGIKIADDLKLKPDCSQGYLFLGELYADNGQREKALENLKKAENMFQEMGMDYWLSKTQEVLERL
jgi:tetratricopeptide (TPR) repeat protein